MNTPFEKDILEAPAAGLTTFLSKVMDHLFGAWVRQEAIGRITWADLYALLWVLLGLLLFNGWVFWWLKKHKKPAAPGDPSIHWRRRILDAVGKPIYLAIWDYGIYLLATPLLLKVRPDEGLHAFHHLLDALLSASLFAAIVWLLIRLTRVLEAWLMTLARKTTTKIDDLFVPLLGQSLRVVIPVMGVLFALPVMGLPQEYATVVGHGSSILIIGTVSWILFQAVSFGEKAVLASHDVTVSDNLHARRLYTQIHIFGTLLQVVIAIFTAGSILMLFEEVRHVGASLLASAGVIGVIAGFAAQKTIANVFAGFQLALSQPIRLDDVVIVEGSFWGRIEEITFTFVVVHIWDDTRMVLPLTYFIETPFQNWTRVSAQIMGSVFVWTDYSLPVDQVRAAVKLIVEASPLWDRRFWNLQVSDATEKTMQLRVLATAVDSSKAWDLRCEIREKLIAFIQKNHPESLPRVRASLDAPLTGPGDRLPRPMP